MGGNEYPNPALCARELIPARSEEWEALEKELNKEPVTLPEQYSVLVTCRDEAQQRELLERFGAEGLECRAIQS